MGGFQILNLRTVFKYTLPNGYGFTSTAGTKIGGKMRLVKVRDLVEIERDKSVKQGSGVFYVILLSRVLVELGTETAINRKTIEKLVPADFAFLVDFLHEINHQVIKKIPLTCETCGHHFWGALTKLGEA
jgi:hypothetical protein